MSEKKYYEEYLSRYVRVAKKMGGKTYYYNGYVSAILEHKIVMDDRKIGQVVIDFDVIQSIEEIENLDLKETEGKNGNRTI